jgi:hypothetical protein
VKNLKKEKKREMWRIWKRRRCSGESFQQEEEEDLDHVENLEIFVFLGSLLSEADAATHWVLNPRGRLENDVVHASFVFQ